MIAGIPSRWQGWLSLLLTLALLGTPALATGELVCLPSCCTGVQACQMGGSHASGTAKMAPASGPSGAAMSQDAAMGSTMDSAMGSAMDSATGSVMAGMGAACPMAAAAPARERRADRRAKSTSSEKTVRRRVIGAGAAAPSSGPAHDCCCALSGVRHAAAQVTPSFPPLWTLVKAPFLKSERVAAGRAPGVRSLAPPPVSPPPRGL